MQPPTAATNGARHVDAIKVTVRSSRGDGSRLFAVEAPSNGTIADVKQLLCRLPHSLCSDASTLVLVLRGKGTAVVRALKLEISI
jgi:hypothetical protein